jgi:hypothetical protein
MPTETSTEQPVPPTNEPCVIQDIIDKLTEIYAAKNDAYSALSDASKNRGGLDEAFARTAALGEQTAAMEALYAARKIYNNSLTNTEFYNRLRNRVIA